MQSQPCSPLAIPAIRTTYLPNCERAKYPATGGRSNKAFAKDHSTSQTRPQPAMNDKRTPSLSALGAGSIVLRVLFAIFLLALPRPIMASPAAVTLNTPRDFPNIASAKEWQSRAREIREQV